MAAPLVAVPAYHLEAGRVTKWRHGGIASPSGYIESLHRAGARGAVLMPEEIDAGDAGALLERFDGLLLLGGGDVEPARYGQERGDEVYGVLPRRDTFELALVEAVIARGLPVLAICRGHQVLNVALGGTLDQHVPDRGGDVLHGTPGGDAEPVLHDVDVQHGSRLAAALGTTRASVSSHHHQAVEKLGDGLEAVAWADDGIVEGIELVDGDAWVVGVQWHPEDTAATDPVQQRLFDTFAQECRRS